MPVGPVISIWSLAYPLVAAQALFFAILLWKKTNGNLVGNRFLAAFLVTLAVAACDEFILTTGYAYYYPHLMQLAWPVNFLHAPLLYLYVVAYAGSDCRWRPRTLMHFVPFVIDFLLMLPFYSLTAEAKRAALTGTSTEPIFLPHGDSLVNVIQIAIYLVLCIRLINDHEIRIRGCLSNIDRVSLGWLRRVIVGAAMLVGVFAVWELAPLPPGQAGAVGSVLYVLMASVIYVLGYYALRQPETLNYFVASARLVAPSIEAVGLSGTRAEPMSQNSVTSPDEDRSGRYVKSALGQEQAERIVAKASAALRGERIFENNSLTLPDLAERLGISVNYLSQAINAVTGSNFYDFVNRCRIDEAMRRLNEDSSGTQSMTDLAFAVGFNSKSTFYKTFKKFTGIAPGEYKNRPNALASSVQTESAPSQPTFRPTGADDNTAISG